ncbi:MAG: hypothetical protein OSA93_04720 [Akkermansiaceae bacterium]|nr:hypothetical protein [Akkermansiaceae bacterium]
MKRLFSIFCLAAGLATASPIVHIDKFGKSLGGWNDKGKYAEFERSGSIYRTWRPEITPMVNGGVFVSLRVDHLRGVFASDDHASLEVTFAPDGTVESARSSLALQGKRVTSDLIAGTGKLGANVAGLDRAAKVGAELLANLSAKILRENIREPGRVTFPAVLNHNYNLLCLAVTNVALAELVLEDDDEKDEEDDETEAPEEEKVEDPEVPTVVPLVIEKPPAKK